MVEGIATELARAICSSRASVPGTEELLADSCGGALFGGVVDSRGCPNGGERKEDGDSGED